MLSVKTSYSPMSSAISASVFPSSLFSLS